MWKEGCGHTSRSVPLTDISIRQTFVLVHTGHLVGAPQFKQYVSPVCCQTTVAKCDVSRSKYINVAAIRLL